MPDQLERLLSKMPLIAKAVNAFDSPVVQEQAFGALIGAASREFSGGRVQEEREAVGDQQGKRGNSDKRLPDDNTRAKEVGSPYPTPPDTNADVSADEFFDALAKESGVAESELRQVFHLDASTLEVVLPTRELGNNKTAQAQAVVVLVAGGRRGGLGESIVKAEVVREECKRKNCYDSKNFSRHHVAKLDGFNLRGRGGNSEILVGPKWVGEFDKVVARLVEREADS